MPPDKFSRHREANKSNEKPKKSDSARRTEAETLMEKIMSIGFPTEDPGIVELKRLFDDFADNGIGGSGAVHLPEFKVSILYKLSVQPHIVSDAIIRKTG